MCKETCKTTKLTLVSQFSNILTLSFYFWVSWEIQMCAVPSQWHSHGQACGSPQVDIHCIKFFHRSRFLCNLRLPWKNRVALKFSTVLNILFIIQDFWATCACPENRVCSGMFHCRLLNMYFLSFRIVEQLALALKNRVALQIFTAFSTLVTFRIFNNLRLPWKQSLPLKFSTVLDIFLPFRIFEQLCACPELSRCVEYTFTFRSFPPLPPFALKNRGCREFTVLDMYFLLFRIFEQLALALKTELPWNFSLYSTCIFYSGFLSKLRLPWKQSLP